MSATSCPHCHADRQTLSARRYPPPAPCSSGEFVLISAVLVALVVTANGFLSAFFNVPDFRYYELGVVACIALLNGMVVFFCHRTSLKQLRRYQSLSFCETCRLLFDDQGQEVPDTSKGFNILMQGEKKVQKTREGRSC